MYYKRGLVGEMYGKAKGKKNRQKADNLNAEAQFWRNMALKKVGDKIKAGQVVAILEAMKMENEIQSEYDGTVTSINVSQGDSVLEGAPIVMVG